MTGIYILFALAVVMVTAAAFLYSKADSNNFDNALTEFGKIRGEVRACAENNDIQKRALDQMSNNVVALSESIQKLMELNQEQQRFQANIDEGTKSKIDILEIRQRTLEKRIIEQSKSMSLRFENSVPIEIVDKPKSKGTGSLLQ